MTDFIRAEDLRLDTAFSAISGGFHSCEHDGIFAAVAKFINQTSGLQRKFIMLNSTKAQINAIQM